jgi:hypothetical protein
VFLVKPSCLETEIFALEREPINPDYSAGKQTKECSSGQPSDMVNEIDGIEGVRMVGCGETGREAIRPEFDRSIMIDFQGAKITSDTGFLLLRAIDERFGIMGPIENELEDTRSCVHSNHTQLQMVRQRVYQMAAGYEDCNDADFLRIYPALRLPIGKGDEAGAVSPGYRGLRMKFWEPKMD